MKDNKKEIQNIKNINRKPTGRSTPIPTYGDIIHSDIPTIDPHKVGTPPPDRKRIKK